MLQFKPADDKMHFCIQVSFVTFHTTNDLTIQRTKMQFRFSAHAMPIEIEFGKGRYV